ncbi:n1-acetylpolyamine oxidase [Fusarium tjaetaba]|uniref:Amine oxidase n=1 Tax=Fusarium tjaetaba TaxID=1567544 RepID=A0A8H5QDN4_9HYPO|nr:n1-acetylpolyamine oxidase [Fusarium tjaetaba]KAF5613362.1 n1-acetylpolyamine oxidase [Fusarium tjaetaba]
MRYSITQLTAVLTTLSTTAQSAVLPREKQGSCTKTKVAILGAGVAGIAAAQNLTNAGIDDFIIVEYNDYIGGRMRKQSFGKNADGKPYTIEFGANWVEGIGSEATHENPIWQLAKKYDLKSNKSDYENYLTFDHKGQTNWSSTIKDLEKIYSKAEAEAGRLLLSNLQDTSVRAAIRSAGWRPDKDDMHAQAADWWKWDFESAWTPDESGLIFGVAGGNATFGYFSDVSNLVVDQRGFSTIIQEEAKTFLKNGDSRLRLKTTVKGVKYGKDGVKITTEKGDCIQADYAICTFSLGVLQSNTTEFSPPLPDWKQSAIDQFAMGTYTKIFMQFEEAFWDNKTQFFLYADPLERGRYPLFQSLNPKGFAPGSNILFGTVTGEQAWRVERQSNNETMEEILDVLRLMFPKKNVTTPTAFTYPRWSTEPWAYGSYSNWPVGMTLEKHQNMRANVERLYFAGEANSAEFFGFLHGAYTEGRDIANKIGNILNGKAGDDEFDMERYENLHGTTFVDEYDEDNGWLFPYDVEGDEEEGEEE